MNPSRYMQRRRGMTEETVTQMIEEMDLPFAYHHFAEGEAPKLP